MSITVLLSTVIPLSSSTPSSSSSSITSPSSTTSSPSSSPSPSSSSQSRRLSLLLFCRQMSVIQIHLVLRGKRGLLYRLWIYSLSLRVHRTDSRRTWTRPEIGNILLTYYRSSDDAQICTLSWLGTPRWGISLFHSSYSHRSERPEATRNEESRQPLSFCPLPKRQIICFLSFPSYLECYCHFSRSAFLTFALFQFHLLRSFVRCDNGWATIARESEEKIFSKPLIYCFNHPTNSCWIANLIIKKFRNKTISSFSPHMTSCWIHIRQYKDDCYDYCNKN